jgi:hypothetical protein
MWGGSTENLVGVPFGKILDSVFYQFLSISFWCLAHLRDGGYSDSGYNVLAGFQDASNQAFGSACFCIATMLKLLSADC